MAPSSTGGVSACACTRIDNQQPDIILRKTRVAMADVVRTPA
ncbi:MULTISPECIES: hypothetical protein [Cyanophyceae]|nr:MULTISPECIES: hypothetical protein [unclassified Trichocoleus]